MIAIAVVQGIDNRIDDPEIWPMLETEIERAAAAVSDGEISQHPAVAPWRAAFAQFGVKPSKYRSSIEAMLRSAQSGRLRSINPLVDLYNTISLRHQLPVGGEDLAKIIGDVRLTRANGDELFVPLGAEAPEFPPPVSVIYRDDESVICSCWNWREAERTMLTVDTTDAVLVIESIPPLDPRGGSSSDRRPGGAGDTTFGRDGGGIGAERGKSVGRDLIDSTAPWNCTEALDFFHTVHFDEVHPEFLHRYAEIPGFGPSPRTNG